jgi:hypothetical protein
VSGSDVEEQGHSTTLEDYPLPDQELALRPLPSNFVTYNTGHTPCWYETFIEIATVIVIKT